MRPQAFQIVLAIHCLYGCVHAMSMYDNKRARLDTAMALAFAGPVLAPAYALGNYIDRQKPPRFIVPSSRRE
jgi:hypothetical protein